MLARQRTLCDKVAVYWRGFSLQPHATIPWMGCGSLSCLLLLLSFFLSLFGTRLSLLGTVRPT